MNSHQTNTDKIFSSGTCGADLRVTVSTARVTGSRHRKNRQSCQDTVLTRADGNFLFCGLADGQSGTEYGREGGLACLEAVADYIARTGIEELLDSPFPDELPCGIVRAFRRKLLSLAQSKGADLPEFSSTLLVLAADLNAGKYALIHLGDGSAVSIPQEGDPVILSAPENGISAYHTWLTTSQTAVAHLRVTFGSLENRTRILLMSDGATCLCRGREIPRRAKELLKSGSPEQLARHLAKSDPVDDATCITVDPAKF